MPSGDKEIPGLTNNRISTMRVLNAKISWPGINVINNEDSYSFYCQIYLVVATYSARKMLRTVCFKIVDLNYSIKWRSHLLL